MRAVLVVLLLVPSLTGAASILQASASVDDGVYSVSVGTHINAPTATVMRTLTDYAHLTRINPDILESRVLQVFSPTRHRVSTLIRACILIFCRDVRQVQDVERLSDSHVVADIVPELSDFRNGAAEWKLHRLQDATLLQFTARVEPDFWVPPIIGAWLFRRKIVSEMLVASAYMETDAVATVRP